MSNLYLPLTWVALEGAMQQPDPAAPQEQTANRVPKLLVTGRIDDPTCYGVCCMKHSKCARWQQLGQASDTETTIDHCSMDYELYVGPTP